MRRIDARFLVVLVLALSVSRPGQACPWDPPTDPCRTEAEIREMNEELELIEEVPAETDPEPENAPIEEDDNSAPDPTCEEVAQSLLEPDPDVRLSVLERLGSRPSDIEDCPQALGALARILRQETDAFLVYRGLIALAFTFEPSADLQDAVVGLLIHPSPDVRRFAAQILPGGDLEPRDQERVAALLPRERDPWVVLALAQMDPPGHEAEVRAALERLVSERGPASATALRVLMQDGQDVQTLLGAMQEGTTLRGVALDLMTRNVEDPSVQRALLQVLQHGSESERVQAAMALLWDDTATHGAAWRQVVLGADLSLRERAVLVLQASYREPWKSIACDAERADAELAGEVARVLAEKEHLYEVMNAWRPEEPSPEPGGWIEPEVGASTVRCASRPFGPPRPDHARIPAGTLFGSMHRFVQDGVEWVAEWDGTCWLRADSLAPEQREEDGDLGPLEADIPVWLLSHLQAALDAGDVELFDSVDGFTGIRLRDASAGLQSLWRSGQDGVLDVLATVEEKAQNR